MTSKIRVNQTYTHILNDTMSIETILQVSPEENLRIKQFYNKSDEELESTVKNIRKWLGTQPHLPNAQDDIFLESMLKLNKLNVDKTQNKLDMYYSIKHVVPEFFENRSPLSDELRSFMDSFMIVPLPQLTKDMYRVYIIKFINSDPEKFDLMTNAKLLLNLFDIRLHYDSAPGEIYIYDLADLRFGHVMKVNPMILKKIYTVMEKAYSDRIQGIHFLNLPMIGNALISISKLILSEKLANRVYSHKNLDSLNEIIPLNLLPADYNGSQRSLEELYANWRKFIESKNSWLLEIGEKKSNEELRPNKEVTSDIFSSIFGFFRKE